MSNGGKNNMGLPPPQLECQLGKVGQGDTGMTLIYDTILINLTIIRFEVG